MRIKHLLVTLLACIIYSIGIGQTWQGTTVANSGNDNTQLGEPNGGQVGTPSPTFELEVHGDGTFGDSNWGRGILIRTPDNTSRGSGIVWSRNFTGGGTANDYYIAGPQNGGQIYTGDFFTGISLGQNPGDQTTWITRIDGNSTNGSAGWGSFLGGGLGYNNPIRGHTQYFRDVYFLSRNAESPRVHPRLGINVAGAGVTASLHVGCQFENGGVITPNSGMVRFECLDEDVVPTLNIVCDDDGNLTYAPLGAGSLQNNCLTPGTLPKVSNASGDLDCSVITQNAGNIGISQGAPNEKLDVSGNIRASVSVIAANTAQGFRLGTGQTVLAHGGSLGIGYNAGLNGDFNTSCGDEAGRNQLTTATFNTSIGRQSGLNLSSGSRNSFLGSNSGERNTTGARNTMLGAFSGNLTTTGLYNTFVGDLAGRNNVTGSGNTVVGAADASWHSGPIWAGLENCATFGYNTDITTSNSQRFGNPDVERWAFGLRPDQAAKVIRVRLPGTLAPDFFVEAFMDAGGVWNQVSDRNLKTNIETVDHREVLDKLVDLDLTAWSYKEDQDIRHIGPMAQDFYAAFGLGHGETTISTLDPTGVALSAIKGLHQAFEEQSLELEEQSRTIASLAQQIEEMQVELSDCCDSSPKSSLQYEETRNVLFQNSPNPFSERTDIGYRLSDNVKEAMLLIYSLSGEHIKTLSLNQNDKKVTLEGGSLSEGSYIYTLSVDGRHVDSKIMIITR